MAQKSKGLTANLAQHGSAKFTEAMLVTKPNTSSARGTALATVRR
jgi:hypothetical protein